MINDLFLYLVKKWYIFASVFILAFFVAGALSYIRLEEKSRIIKNDSSENQLKIEIFISSYTKVKNERERLKGILYKNETELSSLEMEELCYFNNLIKEQKEMIIEYMPNIVPTSNIYDGIETGSRDFKVLLIKHSIVGAISGVALIIFVFCWKYLFGVRFHRKKEGN